MKQPANRYPIEVFWSEEDEGFIARAPDLKGCSAWGETEADAVREIRLAIEAWVEAANAAGNKISPPSDLANRKYSGNFMVRATPNLHERLVRASERQNVSLNHYVNEALTTAVTHFEVMSSFSPPRDDVIYSAEKMVAYITVPGITLGSTISTTAAVALASGLDVISDQQEPFNVDIPVNIDWVRH